MTFRRNGAASARKGLAVSLAALAVTLGACQERRRAELAPSLPGEERREARPQVQERGGGPPVSPTEPGAAGSGSGVSRPPAPEWKSAGDSFRPPAPPRVRFAVIGDYGSAGPAEEQVAQLVDSFAIDFVVTTGDNNYPSGAAETIDDNIGQYFSELIHPYLGKYASSATENRFFPVLGNHDWYTPNAAPYLAYFTLPGNERYYDIVRGDVHFFAIDSDQNEPDGITADSVQGQWLKRALEGSTSAFNVVAMHHPPYSSGPHGNTPAMQWPFATWGADLVLAGHDHGYERLQIDGIPYVVSGLGGASLYSYGEPVAGSLIRYSSQYGALLVEADAQNLDLSFFSTDGRLIDSTVIARR